MILTIFTCFSIQINKEFLQPINFTTTRILYSPILVAEIALTGRIDLTRTKKRIVHYKTFIVDSSKNINKKWGSHSRLPYYRKSPVTLHLRQL